MKEKKPINWETKQAAFFLLPLGVLFFIFAAFASGFWKGLCIFLTVAALAAGVFFLYRDYAHAKNRVNYFLYDARRRRRIPEADLTFEIADDRLGQFIGAYAEAPLTLWNGIPKGLHTELQAKSAFRPLVAYQMLHELSVLPPEELTDIFFEMKRHGDNEGKRIIAFFTKNKSCFEGRILRYIRANKNEFIIETDKKEAKL